MRALAWPAITAAAWLRLAGTARSRGGRALKNLSDRPVVSGTVSLDVQGHSMARPERDDGELAFRLIAFATTTRLASSAGEPVPTSITQPERRRGATRPAAGRVA